MLQLAIAPFGFAARPSTNTPVMNDDPTPGYCPAPGEFYFTETIAWTDGVDMSEGSLHYKAGIGDDNPWPKDVTASRVFRTLPAGKDAYNYRSKVLMGMAQTRVLNEPPSTTPKDAVTFTLPSLSKPATPEGIMMLSVLEMQSLLRSGQMTSMELTGIAFDMLEKYDAEFNMVEVPSRDLALQYAAAADSDFSKNIFKSYIQGIPFAIKDTYDLAGHATAYGSWEYLDNVVDTESPLVTYALQAGAVPLFKSSVPQLTWGFANFNGTTYSCLNGGYSAGAGSSGGSSIGSGTAVCLGVVPISICEQTGSSCQAPAIANGISTLIPAIGTFSRENNGLYSMESDRPGLFCRDVMSCAVFYNYMRGKSEGDPQSRDVPFQDPATVDISSLTIGFADNSETTGWPEAWDTPLKGKRGNVKDKLVESGATVIEKPHLKDFFVLPQLLLDYEAAGIGNEWFGWWDWYWLNVEGFFEDKFKYGSSKGSSYGPVWYGQNTNFDKGDHKHHILASAYAYLDDLWIHGFVSEKAMYPMLEEQMPDVVVHFAQSELNGAVNKGMVKRAGINTVHFPEFFWDVTDTGGWKSGHDAAYEDFYAATPHHPAMITCESKKYEPAKALAVCDYLQKELVAGGKLISPNIATIHAAIKDGTHDLDCPYLWDDKPGYAGYPDSVAGMPEYLKAKIHAKKKNIGKSVSCKVVVGGCDGGTCG